MGGWVGGWVGGGRWRWWWWWWWLHTYVRMGRWPNWCSHCAHEFKALAALERDPFAAVEICGPGSSMEGLTGLHCLAMRTSVLWVRFGVSEDEYADLCSCLNGGLRARRAVLRPRTELAEQWHAEQWQAYVSVAGSAMAGQYQAGQLQAGQWQGSCKHTHTHTHARAREKRTSACSRAHLLRSRLLRRSRMREPRAG